MNTYQEQCVSCGCLVADTNEDCLCRNCAFVASVRELAKSAEWVFACFTPEHLDYVSRENCGTRMRDALAAVERHLPAEPNP